MPTGANRGNGPDLVAYGDALAAAVTEALPGWVAACVRTRCEDAGISFTAEIEAEAIAAGRRAADEVGRRLRALVRTDADRQRETPLSVIRLAVAHPTRVLEAAGVPPVDRDEFSTQRFPGDPYDLSPAAFADLGPEVHRCGIAWGAARTHRHLNPP